MDVCMYAYISWPTVVGDLNASFSIATTPWYRRGRYSFPWIALFTLDPCHIMLSIKQRGIKYHFFVFGMTRPGNIYIIIIIIIIARIP